MPDIIATNHAIKQYRRKMFDYKRTDEEIKLLLTNIARNGAKIHNRPAEYKKSAAYEIKFKGLSIVLKTIKDKITPSIIVTFLGDEIYCDWYRKKQSNYRKVG